MSLIQDFRFLNSFGGSSEEFKNFILSIDLEKVNENIGIFVFIEEYDQGGLKNHREWQIKFLKIVTDVLANFKEKKVDTEIVEKIFQEIDFGNSSNFTNYDANSAMKIQNLLPSSLPNELLIAPETCYLINPNSLKIEHLDWAIRDEILGKFQESFLINLEIRDGQMTRRQRDYSKELARNLEWFMVFEKVLEEEPSFEQNRPDRQYFEIAESYSDRLEMDNEEGNVCEVLGEVEELNGGSLRREMQELSEYGSG